MQAEFYRRTVIDNPWIPVSPFPRQQAFLSETETECLFGGAAGGGKSVGILAAALQFVPTPGYSAILLRRTYQDLNQPKALIPLSHEWLQGTKAAWDSRTFRWHFPNGATLSFGYLDSANDIYRYQGAEYQFIGFDELTQFTEDQYTYLFSRLRKPAGMACRLRMRATSNPGGIGHDWVRQRFITEKHPQRIFVPARLENNPGLDRESYEAQLDKLDPVTRAQLRHGDWDIRPEGNLFKRAWFAGKIIDEAPADLKRRVRYWDLAATEAAPGVDPDYTAGTLIGLDKQGGFVVEDSQEFRATPKDVEDAIRATAAADGRGVEIFIEQEPGASGKSLIAHYQRTVLAGYTVYGVKSTGDKITRAKPFSAACENGLVRLVRGSWIGRFLDRLTGFGLPGVHDDTTDSAAGAHTQLAKRREPWSEDKVQSAFDGPGKSLDDQPVRQERDPFARLLRRSRASGLDLDDGAREF